MGSSKIPEDRPSSGLVEFDGVWARYSAKLDYVLHDVSFTIAPGERIGMVGRTGAGKSTLALTLLRSLEIERGQIRIDGVDTKDVDLHELRRRRAYVPQDPTLFTGTLRHNLHPFEEHTDEEVLGALGRVGLPDDDDDNDDDDDDDDNNSGTTTSSNTTSKFSDLTFAVSEAGSNISQGQSQLVCIACAVLRGSKVVIMDEATASTDQNSDLKIQACVRGLQATVVTIAHRLRTVIDYDRIISLDAGEVRESSHPWELLQRRRDGHFKGMCEADVDSRELVALAKAAWETRS